MIREEEVFCIGRIGKPHGIRGEVLMHIDDDIFDRVEADYVVLQVEGILVPFFIEEYRFRSDETVIMKFEGIDSQEQARQLTHCGVYFPHRLAETDEETPSWNRLAGMTMIDSATQSVVGRIAGVDDTTANILFEVETEKGNILVPAAEELITDIDWEQRLLHIALPEGLLTL